ncbi:MAG TPA: hypothetical protein VHC69_25355 [Polyangiaceae bacterium]|nr:hypothetical protein [Polyangiaceae bacterium]
MSLQVAERLVRALLFEGHVLYPYRASSLKNRRRWAFGTLYPRRFCELTKASDACSMRTECLVVGSAPAVQVSVRFLRMLARSGATEPEREPWNEAVERRIETGELSLPALSDTSRQVELGIDASSSTEEDVTRRGEALSAVVCVSAARLEVSLWKLTVRVENTTDVGTNATDRERAELSALGSAHALLSCREGRFVSSIDPPPELAAHAARCRSEGVWPVLVGDERKRDTVLASPIILSDYPEIAEASPGDLFDATEIDEILSLRIRTLSESERREAIATDPRAREIIQRSEALGEEELLALHGICALPRGAAVEQAIFEPGDAVVLRPRAGGDVLDLALSGETATVLAREEDLDGRVYYTVTVDADPGRDLGALGQPGHRFFFGADELERP